MSEFKLTKFNLEVGSFALSKTCVKRPSQHDRKLVLKTNYCLMQVIQVSIAECSKGNILQYFRPSIGYHFSLRSLFCLILSALHRCYCIVHLTRSVKLALILLQQLTFTKDLSCALFLSNNDNIANYNVLMSYAFNNVLFI